MRILVDGDAFPDLDDVISLASKYKVAINIYMDTNHYLISDYAKIIFVSPGANQVDLVIENEVRNGDLVLTQDYGVATIALARKAIAINQKGKFYTDDNIDMLLAQKTIAMKQRRYSKLKGPRKRKKEDTKNLLKSIETILLERKK